MVRFDYLPDFPPKDVAEVRGWIERSLKNEALLFSAVVDRASGRGGIALPAGVTRERSRAVGDLLILSEGIHWFGPFRPSMSDPQVSVRAPLESGRSFRGPR